MICNKCGNQSSDSSRFCEHCGSELGAPVVPPIPQPPMPGVPFQQSIPEKYRPLSPWAYFGLSILFSIPVVGFIFLIVFSFSGSNINRRNYARSYWCALIIVGILAIIVAIFAALFLYNVPVSDIAPMR